MRVFARASELAGAALVMALAAGWASAGGDAAGAGLPRVVSMNLCTDQIAMQLAAEGQLLSVSAVALDPSSSSMAEEARAYPANTGRAEEIFLLRPDVVLAGVWADPATVTMLRRLGIEVVQVPIVTRLAEIPAQIREVGAAMARGEAAEAMASEVEARLAALPPPPPQRPLAAFYYANGYSLGRDTLGGDIVAAAGFANLAEMTGQRAGGVLALEELVLHAPDLIISGTPYPAHSRAEEVMRHPVLARRAAEGRVALSSADWVCGNSFTMRALDGMLEWRRRLLAEAPGG
jgi:iron complex transport system substrate-binding protein